MVKPTLCVVVLSGETEVEDERRAGALRVLIGLGRAKRLRVPAPDEAVAAVAGGDLPGGAELVGVDVVEAAAAQLADGDIAQVHGGADGAAAGIGLSKEHRIVLLGGAGAGPGEADGVADALGTGATLGEQIEGGLGGGRVDFDYVTLVVLYRVVEVDGGLVDGDAVAADVGAVNILGIGAAAAESDIGLAGEAGGQGGGVLDARHQVAVTSRCGGRGFELIVEAHALGGVKHGAVHIGPGGTAAAGGDIADLEAGLGADALAAVPGYLAIGVGAGILIDAVRVVAVGRCSRGGLPRRQGPVRSGVADVGENSAIAATGNSSHRGIAKIQVFGGNNAAAIGFGDEVAGVIVEVVGEGVATVGLADALAEGIDEVVGAADAVGNDSEAFAGVVGVGVAAVVHYLALGVVAVGMRALACRREAGKAVAAAGEDVVVGS